MAKYDILLMSNILTEREKRIIRFVRHNIGRNLIIQYKFRNIHDEHELDIIEASKVQFYINENGISCIKADWETSLDMIENIYVAFE